MVGLSYTMWNGREICPKMPHFTIDMNAGQLGTVCIQEIMIPEEKNLHIDYL